MPRISDAQPVARDPFFNGAYPPAAGRLFINSQIRERRTTTRKWSSLWFLSLSLSLSLSLFLFPPAENFCGTLGGDGFGAVRTQYVSVRVWKEENELAETKSRKYLRVNHTARSYNWKENKL